MPGALESEPSGLLAGLLLRVLEDLRRAVRRDLVAGRLSALYLVGSAVRQAPPLAWVGGEAVVASDLDLLFFVRPGTTPGERRAMVAAIEAPRPAWGAYLRIHLGCRFRPVSAVRRAVAEYASWGMDVERGVLRLCGAPLIEALPAGERAWWERPLPGTLLRNALSKLWFVIYSLPHDDLRSDLPAPLAFALRRRFASAAHRLATLRSLAGAWRWGEPVDRERSVECDWRSRLLRSGLRDLTRASLPGEGKLDRFERAAAVELLALGAGEVCDLLGAWDCDSWSHQGWRSAVFSLGRILASDAPCLHRLLREAATVLTEEGCGHGSGEDLAKAWPSTVRRLHRAQMPILSPNLISYS